MTGPEKNKETVAFNSNTDRVDQICDRFEANWRKGEHPQIEAYLEEVASDEQSRLFKELLLLELEFRGRNEQLEVGDYLDRFPSQTNVVMEVFSQVNLEMQETLRVSDGDTTESVLQALESGSRFRIVRFLDEGGLGNVWIARDLELHREVALKDIKPECADDVDVRNRFVTEAEITGKLEHPGIVPVYGLGRSDDGRPYYAMRFIQGTTFHDLIKRFHKIPISKEREPAQHRTLELHGLLRRFVDICNTIDFAHSRGVVHRDIKPKNVMIGDYGETLVVDWGLAKIIDDGESKKRDQRDSSLRMTKINQTETMAGAVVGTPQFMSPEQAEGRTSTLNRESDIYSLGAMLYFLLTNRPPFTGSNLTEVLGRVAIGAFKRPREVAAWIPKPLEAVCLKAMALVGRDRYASAGDLAKEIERWLADEPVDAIPESRWERLSRWSRRNRSWVRAGAAGLLLAMSILCISFFIVNELRREAEVLAQRNANLAASEKLARDRAERELERSRRNLYAVQIANIDSLAGSDPGRALLLLRDVQRCPEDLREFAWAYFYRYCRRDVRRWQADPEEVHAAFFVDQDRSIISVGGNNRLRKWDVSTGELISDIESGGRITAAIPSRDRTRLITLQADRSIQVWRLPTLERETAFSEPLGRLDRLAVSENGDRVAVLLTTDPNTTLLRKSVVVWQVGEDSEIASFSVPSESEAIAISPSGSWVVVGGASPRGPEFASLVFWDIQSQKKGAQVSLPLNQGLAYGLAHSISSIEFVDDEQTLLVGTAGGALSRIKMEPLIKGQPNLEIERKLAHHGEIRDLAIGGTSDDVWVATVGPGDPPHTNIHAPFHPIKIWTLDGLHEQTYPADLVDSISGIAFSQGGKRLVAIGSGGFLTLFDWREDWSRRRMGARGPAVIAASMSADASKWLSLSHLEGSRQWALQIRDLKTGQATRESVETSSNLAWVLPNGKIVMETDLVDSRVARRVVLRDIVTGESMGTRSLEPREKFVAFSSRHGIVISIDALRHVRLQNDTEQKNVEGIASRLGPALSHFAFSVDQEWIALGGGDGRGIVYVIDLTSGDLIATLSDIEHPVGSLAFSPDGKLLAVGQLAVSVRTSRSQRLSVTQPAIKLWNVESQRWIGQLQGHDGDVQAICFSEDGNTLASASYQETVKLWDVRSGVELTTLDSGVKGGFPETIGVAFGDAGRTLTLANRDGSIVQWRAADGDDVVQRDARTMMEQLIELVPLKMEWLRRLREDQRITEPVRQQALVLAEEIEETALFLNDAAWRMVGLADNDTVEYEKAIQYAERASSIEPENIGSTAVVAAANYRLGEMKTAMHAIDRFYEHKNAYEHRFHPTLLAFKSMVQWKLQRQQEARQTQTEYELSLETRASMTPDVDQRLLEELSSLLAAPAQ